ncbi:CENPC protein, partial [Crotophaga sulcirostris]|nr:CENPC protein [Crotophaga sulcirostris]
SKKKKTESKEGNKNRKAQVEALTKQKTDDLHVGVHDFKGTSESDPVSNSEGKVRKSQRQNSNPTGKTKKDALGQNTTKGMSWKPEAEELMLSWSGLETKASDEEKFKTRVMPSEDSPMHLAGHQQERAVSPIKNLRSSKYLQLSSKASQPLVSKKKTAKQKLPKGVVAKRLAESPRKKLKKPGKKSIKKKSQLPREESSDSELGEEEVERQPVKLNEVFTSPPRQKLQKLAKSEKPKNVLHTLELPGGVNNHTPVKAQEHRVDSVKSSEKKRLSAKFSGKKPKKIHHRTSKGACSNSEYAESQADSDGSTVQDTARKKQKLSDVKIKNNKRKCNMQHELQLLATLIPFSCHNSNVIEISTGKYCPSHVEQQERRFNVSPLQIFLSYLMQMISSFKLVLPSNTPNVRRSKRIRLRPLEYWRGERVNCAVGTSGRLVITGIACPETRPHRKIKRSKDGHKWKRDETKHQIPVNLDYCLGDSSKPTVVVDPETNEEVLLECINTESADSFFFKDESVEIYKNLNTSAFAIGKLVLKPLKEKGYQYVYMDTLVFHVIRGKVILTLHKTSYYLAAGDCFYVPAGNGYNIRNLQNEESILLFTQLK